jgi:hypothetical protein
LPKVVEPNAQLRVLTTPVLPVLHPAAFVPSHSRGKSMVITAAHLTPIVAILAGILILIIPRLLNYIVAIYLIFVGLVELNAVHHWINWH